MQYAIYGTASESSAYQLLRREEAYYERLSNIDSYRSNSDHRMRSAGFRRRNGRIELNWPQRAPGLHDTGNETAWRTEIGRPIFRIGKDALSTEH